VLLVWLVLVCCRAVDLNSSRRVVDGLDVRGIAELCADQL